MKIVVVRKAVCQLLPGEARRIPQTSAPLFGLTLRCPGCGLRDDVLQGRGQTITEHGNGSVSIASTIVCPSCHLAYTVVEGAVKRVGTSG